jgi:hypothetical protein
MTAFLSTLSSLDLSSSFVTVSVDSNRINATLQAIVSAISTIHSNVDTLTQRADKNDAAVGALQQAMGVQQAKTAVLEEAVNDLKSLPARMATVERNIETRFEQVANDMKRDRDRVGGVETRVTALEKAKADDTAKLKQVLAEAKAMNERVQAALAEMNAKILQTNERIAAVDMMAKGADRKVGLIAGVFEMDLSLAQAVLDRTGTAAAITGSSGGGATAVTARRDLEDVSVTPNGNSSSGTLTAAPVLPACVAYCRNLPSFKSLENHMRRSILEEVAAVKALLDEKLDKSEFRQVLDKVDDCVMKVKGVSDGLQRIQLDVESRVLKSVHRADVDRLQSQKADRAEIVGIVTADDLRVLKDAVAELRNYVDRSVADFQLEVREARIRDNAANKSAIHHTAGGLGAAEMSDLLSRVAELEKKAVQLFDVKADKADLVALQGYIEETLANLSARRDRPGSARGRAATPPSTHDPLASTPRRQLLSPISRPGSASIPDVRAPSAPLYYTSLPVRPQSPERGREHGSASTNIFDSNGHRTSAMLSHCKAVPMEEHLNNMRMAAAGTSRLPDGYIVHEIPVNVRSPSPHA